MTLRFFKLTKNSYNYRNAKRVEDVYKIENILSDVEFQQLIQSGKNLSEEYSTKEKVENGLKTKKFTELLANSLRQNSDFANEDRLGKYTVAET